MVARDFRENKTAVRVVTPANPLFSLASQFGSAEEIIADKGKKVQVFAKALDMEYADCANLLIKLHETHKLLNTPLKIEIDGELVQLQHPISKQPLCIGDVITDRSGPKFSFALDTSVGQEFLDSKCYGERLDIAQSQAKSAEHFAKSIGSNVSAKEIEQCVSAFRSRHKAQGRLTDFDLEVKDFDILESAIGSALQQKMGKKVEDYLVEDIAKSHWVYGGGISTQNVEKATLGKINYLQTEQDRFAAEQRQHKGHKHMLSRSAEVHSAQESALETIRGTAVSFKTLEAKEVMGCLIPALTEGGNIRKIESSDIILNSPPLLGKLYSQYRTIDDTHAKQLVAVLGLSADEGDEVIQRKCAESKNYPFNFSQLAADLAKEYPENRSAIARVAESHRDKTNSHDNALYSQEVGRKNSLCQDQLDEPRKLAWNMENTAESLSGMIAQSRAGNESAIAQLQVAKLSYLISLTGWGVRHC